MTIRASCNYVAPYMGRRNGCALFFGGPILKLLAKRQPRVSLPYFKTHASGPSLPESVPLLARRRKPDRQGIVQGPIARGSHGGSVGQMILENLARAVHACEAKISRDLKDIPTLTFVIGSQPCPKPHFPLFPPKARAAVRPIREQRVQSDMFSRARSRQDASHCRQLGVSG